MTWGRAHGCRRFEDERKETAELGLLAFVSSCRSARSQTGR
jgi:hypothetical protein